MDHDSAVLVLLEQHQSSVKLCYTLRASHLGNHRGQISFPGGRQERGESTEETALREAYEEISLEPSEIQILGRLSPLNVDRSSHRVTPILAITTKPLVLKANPDEVEEIFLVPVSALMDESNIKYERRSLGGIPFLVPYWDVHRVPLWGVTAMITAELLTLLKRIPQSDKKK